MTDNTPHAIEVVMGPHGQVWVYRRDANATMIEATLTKHDHHRDCEKAMQAAMKLQDEFGGVIQIDRQALIRKVHLALLGDRNWIKID